MFKVQGLKRMMYKGKHVKGKKVCIHKAVVEYNLGSEDKARGLSHKEVCDVCGLVLKEHTIN